MLVLPIAQRKGAPPQGEHEGEPPAPFPVGDHGAQGLKVGVKNTFIDVDDAETPASRGAQTAMARIGAGPDVAFSPQADPPGYGGQHRPHALSREDRQGSWVTETPIHIGQKDYTTASTLSPSLAGTTRTAAAVSAGGGDARFGTSSPGYSTPGPIPPPPPAQALYGGLPAVAPYALAPPGPVPYAVSPVVAPPMTSAPSSPSTFSAGRSPVPAPPAYAAPVSFQDQTSQPPPEEAGSLDRGHGYKYNVKNTFIDVQDDATPMGNPWQQPQTCQARFSNEAGLAFKPGALAGASPAAQPAPLSAPSVGSAEHGKTGPDGLPVCQPCAWFYKETGCKNGQTCRYCHLCPNGELKNRKKMKIARLRNQDDSTPKGSPQ